MQMSDSLAEKILKDAGVDSSKILELKAEVKSTHLPLTELILHYNILNEEDLARAYAKELGLPFTNLPVSGLSSSHLQLLPEHMSRRHRVVVFDVLPNASRLVASDAQLPPNTNELLTKVLGSNFSVHITPTSNLHSALDLYRQSGISSPQIIKRPDQQHEPSTVLETVHHILEHAISKRVTSVHIEPKSSTLVVRFRVDGVLREAYKLPHSASLAINSRFKAMAGLNGVGVQEGRFRVESHHNIYRIEVLSLPIIDGEKLTLNIFNESISAPKLEGLGLYGNNLETVERALISKHGLVLVSGPKDNGKNTALYSLLESIKLGNLNVLTIEDKLSYRVSGASQLELNPSVPSYEMALEVAKKQEPEVLLVNKVLGPETANHILDISRRTLTLAGVDTNSSLNALTQLTHLGVEHFRLAHITRLSMSVRLVRKLCDNCKIPVHPSTASLKNLMLNLDINNCGGIKMVHHLEKQAASQTLGSLGKTDLSSTDSGIKRLFEANTEGCEDCGYTGYRGRLGLQEVLDLNEDIKAKFAANADYSDILKLAAKSGFIPLSIDGLVKALRGLTTIDEILSSL